MQLISQVPAAANCTAPLRQRRGALRMSSRALWMPLALVSLAIIILAAKRALGGSYPTSSQKGVCCMYCTVLVDERLPCLVVISWSQESVSTGTWASLDCAMHAKLNRTFPIDISLLGIFLMTPAPSQLPYDGPLH